jgi:chromatin assembly factor 1 subunit B
MKCVIPEISWHNREPVLSVDFQPQQAEDNFTRLASGGSGKIFILIQLKLNNNSFCRFSCFNLVSFFRRGNNST